MKKAYLSLSAIAIIATLVAGGFYIFRSKQKADQKILDKTGQKTETSASKSNTSSDYNSSSPNMNNSSDSQTQKKVERETLNWDNFTPPTVLPKDCDQNCRKFSDERERNYCWKVCELPEEMESENQVGDADDETGDDTENNSNDESDTAVQDIDCEKLQSIERDICLKDKGVGARDFNICDQISDSQIRKTCKNRITEDILNSQ
jgi:hypothetical protein